MKKAANRAAAQSLDALATVRLLRFWAVANTAFLSLSQRDVASRESRSDCRTGEHRDRARCRPGVRAMTRFRLVVDIRSRGFGNAAPTPKGLA